MGKIRINELARELEVKAHEILEKLPELGVSEKKTHSSSLDDDVVLKLRRYYGHEAEEGSPAAEHEPARAEHPPASAETAPVSNGQPKSAQPAAEPEAAHAEPAARREAPV